MWFGPSGGGGNVSGINAGYVLKVTGLAEELNMECEKKTRVRVDSMAFGLSTWQNGTAIYEGGGRLWK